MRALALLRYRYPDGRLQAALPMHVVDESDGVLVGWTPPGTGIAYWATEDGRDPREVPLERRFGIRLTSARRRWTGGGVLRVIPVDRTWQALHFWNDDGGFAGWYANLESTKTRTEPDAGAADPVVLDAVDHHLDLVIAPDRTPSWKDEHEAAAAIGTEYLRAEDLATARSTGERIAADVDGWLAEVGDWRSFRPPRSWAALELPDGWGGVG